MMDDFDFVVIGAGAAGEAAAFEAPRLGASV
jgi:pyruvate/2-oxoglutarate dehydrogenase complex dihydrolipoamide dehydrogenase (E3) component